MKLNVSGNINQYYVQTLCMIFFPGERFSDEVKSDAEESAIPELSLTLNEGDDGVKVFCELSLDEKYASCEKIYPPREYRIADRDLFESVARDILSWRIYLFA